MYNRSVLRKVINARGYVTALGGSVMPPEVVEAMCEASKSYVIMNELQDQASEIIAKVTGAEAGFVTSGAAGGIVIATAACMTGTDLVKIEKLPNTEDFPRRQVLIQRCHMNKYMLMIQLTGAELVPFGYINGPGWTNAEQLRGSINPKTAAVFHVTGGHRHAKGELLLEKVLAVAHEQGIPVIMDAASSPELKKFIDMGCDLVTYSGGKWLRGPGSSGILCGRTDLIQACRRQDWGIARPMKVSKEEIAGLMAALERYDKLDHKAQHEKWCNRQKILCEALSSIPHVETSILDRDETGAPAYLVELRIDESALGHTAGQINAELLKGNPYVRLRDEFTKHGILLLNVVSLLEGEEAELAARLREVLQP